MSSLRKKMGNLRKKFRNHRFFVSLVLLMGRRGSPRWLKAVEQKYGGFFQTPWRKVSPHSPYDASVERHNREYGIMQGGDRMEFHGYAKAYSRNLPLGNRDGQGMVIVEIGVLLGNGLAMWSELFPEARLIGLDIDPGRAESNFPRLRELGAFASREPELHEFDQFEDNADMVKNILKGDRIDICVDDGYHSEESIMQSLKDCSPHMAQDFVYFVEDNAYVHEKIRKDYPEFEVESSGRLAVLKRRATRG